MPDSDWSQASRYVLEALRSLTEAVQQLRQETGRFGVEAAQRFARIDHDEQMIKDLEREFSRLRDEYARYREEMAGRIATIETNAKNRAVLVSVIISVVGSIATAIATAAISK